MDLRDGFARVGAFEAPAEWQQPIAQQLRSLGSGVWGDGYLRVPNPADIMPAFRRLLPHIPETLPVLATAFGDILFIDRNEVMFAALPRFGASRFVDLAGVWGFEFLCSEPAVLASIVPDDGYGPTVERLGIPDIDECFGSALLLALGGSPHPDRLERVSLVRHLELIADMAGPIE